MHAAGFPYFMPAAKLVSGSTAGLPPGFQSSRGLFRGALSPPYYTPWLPNPLRQMFGRWLPRVEYRGSLYLVEALRR